MVSIGDKVGAAVKTAAIGTVSGILATVGIGFLTVAAWLLMTATQTQLFAATVIGAVYLGVALIGFAVAASAGRTPQPRNVQPQELSPLQLVVVSFMDGLAQGSRARKEQ